MPAVYLAVILSASALALSVFSFFFLKSYLKRRTGQERILSELREEIDNIVLSLDEKTDRDISLIEEREKALRSLLGDVDKRLRIYVRELEKRREDEAAHSDLAAKAKAPGYLELGKNRYRLNEQTLPPAASSAPAPVPEAAEVNGSHEVEPHAVDPAPAAQIPVGKQIRELVRAGFTPPVIASRLGLSIAEVEVVTALMERRER